MTTSEATVPKMSTKVKGSEFKLPFKRVLNGHLIVQIDEFRRPAGSRIIIPDTAKRKPTKGKVLAKADDITDIQVGDTILYSQFAGYLLEFGGLPLMRTLGRDEILAILEEDAPEIIAEGT